MPETLRMPETPPRVAVTGATGFVGSRLVEMLAERGYPITCLLRAGRTPTWSADASADIRIVRGDLDTAEGVETFLDGAEILVHSAGLTRAATEDRFRIVNVLGSARVASAARSSSAARGSAAAGVRHIIALSSLAAVGPADGPEGVDETTPLHPLTPYGRSKVEMEIEMRRAADPVPCTFIRPPAVYGPRDRDTLGIFRLAARGVRLSPNRHSLLSFVYVDNLVDLIIACIESPNARGEIFMVADDGALTWPEFATLAAESAFGPDAGRKTLDIAIPSWAQAMAAGAAELLKPFLKRPPLANRDKVLEGRQRWWTVNAKKARSLLGFAPPVATRDAVRATLQWYRANGWL